MLNARKSGWQRLTALLLIGLWTSSCSTTTSGRVSRSERQAAPFDSGYAYAQERGGGHQSTEKRTVRAVAGLEPQTKVLTLTEDGSWRAGQPAQPILISDEPDPADPPIRQNPDAQTSQSYPFLCSTETLRSFQACVQHEAILTEELARAQADLDAIPDVVECPECVQEVGLSPLEWIGIGAGIVASFAVGVTVGYVVWGR